MVRCELLLGNADEEVTKGGKKVVLINVEVATRGRVVNFEKRVRFTRDLINNRRFYKGEVPRELQRESIEILLGLMVIYQLHF